VPSEAALAQLNRILDSASFVKATVLTRLLRHLVERTLDGAAGELKEYSLGVEVFDRDTFDPRVDTIVRVQARRLRARLAEYYAAAGRFDPIRIEIPLGGYTATLHAQRTGNARTGAGSTDDALAVPAAPAPIASDRLPASRTPLIGREQDLRAISSLLRNPDIRLVTLTGAGGSGKTRLAIEAARALLDQFPGGVRMLLLAPLADPASAIAALARTLGLRQTGGIPMDDALPEHVARSTTTPTLLLLDNFEHVLDAAPVVGRLLEASVHLKVLATSRAALRLYGEFDCPVLPFPRPDPAMSPERIAAHPAVQLFVQRAQASQHGFQLTPGNAGTLAEICGRLDGLPLAIELAAALDFLTDGPRDLPARQLTLRSTIDWSHRLLSPSEQVLFRRVALFAGGCNESRGWRGRRAAMRLVRGATTHDSPGESHAYETAVRRVPRPAAVCIAGDRRRLSCVRRCTRVLLTLSRPENAFTERHPAG
jgi:hypothetical protein